MYDGVVRLAITPNIMRRIFVEFESSDLFDGITSEMFAARSTQYTNVLEASREDSLSLFQILFPKFCNGFDKENDPGVIVDIYKWANVIAISISGLLRCRQYVNDQNTKYRLV